ncbi:MAG: transcriptional repressor [Chloroflexi bacterium]|nr:transcriptional repressor [Chloroflexota bacterium]
MTTAESLILQLRQAGVRITPQRSAICRLLSETNTHPSASMIWEELRAQYPSLSLMTVYNTLNALAELGAVSVLGHVGDDTVHYDAHTEPHVNLACIACHQIVDFPSAYSAKCSAEIRSASGFNIIGARVVYYGICPECQKHQNNQPQDEKKGNNP